MFSALASLCCCKTNFYSIVLERNERINGKSDSNSCAKDMSEKRERKEENSNVFCVIQAQKNEK